MCCSSKDLNPLPIPPAKSSPANSMARPSAVKQQLCKPSWACSVGLNVTARIRPCFALRCFMLRYVGRISWAGPCLEGFHPFKIRSRLCCYCRLCVCVSKLCVCSNTSSEKYEHQKQYGKYTCIPVSLHAICWELIFKSTFATWARAKYCVAISHANHVSESSCFLAPLRAWCSRAS